MADEPPIPDDLLDLARRHATAAAATRSAAQGGGDVVAATAAEARAAAALAAYRQKHPGWEGLAAQTRVRDTVAGEAE